MAHPDVGSAEGAECGAPRRPGGLGPLEWHRGTRAPGSLSSWGQTCRCLPPTRCPDQIASVTDSQHAPTLVPDSPARRRISDDPDANLLVEGARAPARPLSS